MPLLKTKQGIANSHEAKVRALRDRFYPTPQADLLELDSLSPKESFTVEQSTTIDKILAILAGCSSSSALGDNKILFSFFKALSKLVARALTLLTNTSLRLKHLLPFLKRARTIVLRKPGKASYKTASL